MYSRSCRFVLLNMERSKAPDRFVNAKVYANDLLLGILKCSPKAIDVKELRVFLSVPLNMPPIPRTLSVRKLVKSSVVIARRYANINDIFVTLSVSKLLRSTLVKAEQDENIPAILTHLLVFRRVRPVISCKPVNPEKR